MPVTGCNYKYNIMPGLALNVYDVVREFRLRLSTLLSVSVTKYKLDLASVSSYNRHLASVRAYNRQIAGLSGDLTLKSTPDDDLNYLFYFTYFDKYKIHPFFQEFTNKIKEHIDKLTQSIEALNSSHSQLNKTAEATHDNTKELIDSISEVEEKVKESISKSTEHIKSQIEDNKKKMHDSVTQIEKKITSINSNLRKYINGELGKITEKLKSKIQTIKSTYGTIDSNLSQTKSLLFNIRSNVSTLRNYVDPIIDKIKAYEQRRTSEIEHIKNNVERLGNVMYVRNEVVKIKQALEKIKDEVSLQTIQEVKKELEGIKDDPSKLSIHGARSYIISRLQVCISKLAQAARDAKVREVLDKVKSSLEKDNQKGIKENIEKINTNLQAIKADVTNLELPNFTLDYGQLANDSDIQGFTEYSAKLEQTKSEIGQKKSQIDSAFQDILNSIESLEETKKELETSKDLQVENKGRIRSLIGSLITNKDPIEKSKTKVAEEINKLTSEIQSLKQELETLKPKPKGFPEVLTHGLYSLLSWISPFTFTSSHSEQPNELENIGKQVEKLNPIKVLNEELKGYTKQSKGVRSGQSLLESIKDYVKNLNYEDNKSKITGNNGREEFDFLDYSSKFQPITGTLNKLLIRLKAIDDDNPPKGGDTGKPLLKTVKQSLTDIIKELSHLQKLGYNINNLLKMTEAIKDLKAVERVIEGVKPVNQAVQVVKPTEQELSSTFDRLQKAKQTFMSGLATIESIGSVILDLVGENSQKLERLNQMEQTFDWLRDKHHHISILTFNLQSLVSSEISKKEDTLIAKLNDFDGKLDKQIAKRITTIMSKLEQYSTDYQEINNISNTHTGSQPSTQAGRQVESQPVEVRQGTSVEVTKEVEGIKTIIQDNIQNKIPDLKTNIQYIVANDVTSKYLEYSQKLIEFKQQIDKLYHCIDYVVRDFIRCSLKSTISSVYDIFKFIGVATHTNQPKSESREQSHNTESREKQTQTVRQSQSTRVTCNTDNESQQRETSPRYGGLYTPEVGQDYNSTSNYTSTSRTTLLTSSLTRRILLTTYLDSRSVLTRSLTRLGNRLTCYSWSVLSHLSLSDSKMCVSRLYEY